MLSITSALLIFVGTYTNKDGASRGIYAVQFNQTTGEFSQPVLAAEASNPTFLEMNPNGRVLYAVGESVSGGGAVAFNFDPAAGKLSPLNTESTGGMGCCHLRTDTTGHALVLASYGGGEVTSFPLDATGRVLPRSSLMKHTGQLGPKTARQDKPHPHSITISPDNRFAYVCDLGLDKIFRYGLDPSTARLSVSGDTATTPGDGPRHAKFSADGRSLYVINELGGSVSTYACDPKTGALTFRQTVPTLPIDFKGENTCAEIRLSPDGRFVYGSNRGHDSIAVFSRSQTDGTLTLVEIVPCGGKHPRNFNLTPDGRWLVCASRDTNNLVSFRIDEKSGRLTPSGHAVTIAAPVCVLFAPGT